MEQGTLFKTWQEMCHSTTSSIQYNIMIVLYHIQTVKSVLRFTNIGLCYLQLPWINAQILQWNRRNLIRSFWTSDTTPGALNKSCHLLVTNYLCVSTQCFLPAFLFLFIFIAGCLANYLAHFARGGGKLLKEPFG